MRERFPKLVNHLHYLGVQVAWVTGPWFISIFMNMLPWESGQVSCCLVPIFYQLHNLSRHFKKFLIQLLPLLLVY
ncbi:hypothetical protein HRI_002701700 [Hibiscus trionum]|uniref:Uncharacterized protein n=1 Tax=Hibiscus trionum TaxID=183268 RepID=A0A9W7I6K3_HIBTR|nr:hypothetical protein HRI_002701700 [Hibiscus trionum]